MTEYDLRLEGSLDSAVGSQSVNEQELMRDSPRVTAPNLQ